MSEAEFSCRECDEKRKATEPRYFELACDRLHAEATGSTLAALRSGQTALFGG
jgi:hypothetical protein